MKKVLSDYIKTREDFERFCNLFLKKEVSSLVKVYDAPGPDGGIDAEYTGVYKESTGSWIFQYKFSDPTMDKGDAHSQLISKMKGELDKAHAQQCDHYVLMTNTLLTPDNKQKIEDIKSEKGYTFSLICWDAEDLITMTDEFPYLLNSFRDPHLPVFLPWQDMFRNRIAGQNRLLRYDYHTFGREEEISQFQTFVQDEEKRLLLVYGSGGIGKTKIAIEFAKVIEREHPDYEPLFVQMAGDSFESALADIPPNRNYIFFIDDAHDFIDHLGRIKILLNSPGYRKSKAVLITRKPFKTFLKAVFSDDLPDGAIEERKIEKLSLEKTKEFIRAYARIPDGSLLTGLARMGQDTPLIAVMVIDLLNKEVDLGSLTKDELIERAFESYLNDIFSPHLPKLDKQHRKLLDWLSGIASIDTEDDRIRDKLAELLKVETYEIERYLDDLIDCGLLVQYGRKQRIFPDPLSDYILRKACFLSDGRPFSFHKTLLREFLPLLPVKVVINLARVENIAGEKGLLDKHVASVKIQVQEGDNAVRKNVLDQMEGISYFRPDDALEIFNIILDNPNSEDIEVKDSLWGKSVLTHQILLRKIAMEVRKTVSTLTGFRKTLEILRKLLLTKDLEIPRHSSPESILVEITRFQASGSFAFQREALEVFEVWKKEGKPELTGPMLNVLNSLLILEFSELVNEGAGVGIYPKKLKYTPELAKLRARVFNLAESCLKTSQSPDIRVEAITCISNALHQIRYRIENGITDEKARLFEILGNHILEETDVTVLNAIDECLNEYTSEYSESSDDFSKEKATELLEKFRKHQNYDRYFLYRQLIGKFRDGIPGVEETRGFVKGYVEKYTPIQLSKLMRECLDLAESGWEYGGVTSFFRTICELHPTYGDDLLNHIAEWQIDESCYASALLVGLWDFDKGKAQAAVHRLLNQESIFPKRIVANSYRRSSGRQTFNQEDLQILSQLSKIPDDELLRQYITESLPNFYDVDANTVLEILVALSSDESPTVKRQVIRALTSKELKFPPQNHLEKYKQVMLNCVRLEHLDSEAEQALHTIFKHDDPIWVIEFFEKRIAYQENKSKGYDSLSDHLSESFRFNPFPRRPHYLFKDVDWNDQNAMAALRRVRDWVLKSSNLLRFQAPNLLVSMLSGNGPRSDEIKINPAMLKLFEEWIDSEDLELMREAAYLMRGFDADAVFYSLAESILIKSEGDEQVQGAIVAALYSGVYSRNLGDPDPHLLKRIKDLKALRDRTQSRIVAEFAEDLIKTTEQDIEKQAQEDEEFLEEERW